MWVWHREKPGLHPDSLAPVETFGTLLHDVTQQRQGHDEEADQGSTGPVLSVKDVVWCLHILVQHLEARGQDSDASVVALRKLKLERGVIGIRDY